jgi:hypothetical protein
MQVRFVEQLKPSTNGALTMNAKTLIAGLIATIAATGAFANDQFNGEAYNEAPMVSSSGLTREQVRAELAQAQAADQIAYGEMGQRVAQGESSKTRAQVREETLKAQAEGTMLRNGEG